MFEFSSDQMYTYNLSRPILMPMPMPAVVDRKWMPSVEMAPNCPRCDSSNTKFCYYNNYSLTQPRYFCKGCRRYWTKGGSLRNVPLGGGCRKNRRAKSVRLSSNTSSSSTSTSTSRRTTGSDSLRPDLALDDMVGGSSQSIAGTSSTTSSPDIDLAILYSKFLNREQQPPRSDHDDQGTTLGVPADESFHDLVGSSWGSDQIGEFSYDFDHANGSYESLPLDPTAADQASEVFSTNPLLFQNFSWQPEKLQQAAGFCPVSDIDHMSRHHHHHQDFIGSDWCTSVDQSSFGAF